MVELDSAWKFLSKDWEKTLKFVLFAGLFSLVPIVGALALSGLMVKLINGVVKKKDDIPDVFKDLGDNLMHGLKMLLFQFIIAIPIGAILTFMIGGSMMSMDYDVIVASLIGAVPVLIIIGLLYFLIVPALMCNYAVEKRFSAFFDFSTAFKAVFGKFGNFLRMFVILFVYMIVLGIISSLLSSVIIGAIFVAPLYLLVYSKIIGDWYAENA